MSTVDPANDPLDSDADSSAIEEAPLPEEAERSAIQIDGYKITARFQPAPHGEPKPKDWKDVGEVVHSKLKSIAVNLFGLLDDCLEGSRKAVRGLSEIPGALARRIDRAHEMADRVETKQRDQAEIQALPSRSPELASDQLELFLAALLADGAAVEIREQPDGSQAVVIVKPDDRQLVSGLMRKALPGPTNKDSHSGSGNRTTAQPKRQRRPRQKPNAE